MGEAKQEEAKAETKPEENKEEKKEEKQEEKKEEAAPEEKKEEEKPSPPPPVVLYVDLHCVGCAKKIERSIMKCRGVEGVEMDMVQNQVTVKGIVDPQALCSRIQKKTLRQAKVLSPPPPPEGDSAQPQVVASQVSEITTVELNVNMHCEACAQQLRKKILKMRGVQTAETEAKSGKVLVTGTMNAEKLVEYVHRRTRKLAKIVPRPPKEEEKKEEEKKTEEKPAEENKEEKPAEEKKEENAEKKEEEKPPQPQENADGGGKEAEKAAGGEEEKKEVVEAPVEGFPLSEEDMVKKMVYWAPVYIIERPPPPPQLFSDENPNACCIS